MLARRTPRLLGLLLIPAAMSTAGCAADSDPPAEAVVEHGDAIQGGYVDVDDRAVVGVAITNSEGDVIRTCSGTLISPNLVLTAQHCIAQTSKYVVCETSIFGPPVPASRVYVTTSSSMWSHGTNWLPARSVEAPPGLPIVCGRDMALVLLDDVVPADEAIPIPPRLDSEPTLAEPYSAVGFGSTFQGGKDGGTRRRRDGLIVLCTGAECGSPDHVDGTEWRGDHGVCSGDSGGPALDRQGRVIGVTSRGPAGCDLPIYGGLIHWGAWIAEIGGVAAAAGEYPAPAWIDESRLGIAQAMNRRSRADDGCSQAPGSTSGRRIGFAALAVALVAAAAALRRHLVARGGAGRD